ncbi:glycerol-3-phosphate acyltransferase [Gloeothece verrucosa]|uniref:Pyruvate phosphate dikinase PEP/pyruvate-binding protein n=1 Tax=Gloeothece verrucosa (strain PCC 7822) TaxID=497965 RepID=E0U889_GLOV7|nr:glycerol-3-phosphate acyltransferase [Gloeothece verrucosa]ADN17294.1 pyruvate phosphate dikinase PEP/pyruvate-binding protein [Gloeothece verrucosa PCC 7822]
MTLLQVWGCLLIFVLCPLLGGLPLINWITYALTGRQLSKLGTGNVSVSAAFYHGGTLVGILAVVSEALKGILAVLLARQFFPSGSLWELVALMALVMGRYWMGKGAGTTNVVWGIVVHDPVTAALTLLIGGTSFTIFRDRASGRLVILFLFALILALRHSTQTEYIIAAFLLAGLIGWIYHKIPDDLDLPDSDVNPQSQQMFDFFRGDKAIITLNSKLEAAKVGEKAATLSYLKRLGYAVPDGWVLPPGDDFQPLIEALNPSVANPLVVRSSAIGEDSETASAAGQYTSILNVTQREALQEAIIACQTSYNHPLAVQYRQDRQQIDNAMAVLIQKQISGVFSGVAFSRDPLDQLNTCVVIEALPGQATQVVSGRVTPQQYYVDVPAQNEGHTEVTIQQGQEGDIPPSIIKAVAILARELEDLYHGIPQDLEWSYDGQQIWLLQARPITTLQPIWTRKIAAEVIPGVIRPLTWSINCPLTCGVWGDIFSLVLGKRAKNLDFSETATLHYQRAYFNATLLGKIFRRMGLPPESLEFLTRGAQFSKPPLTSTLRNTPGLLRLLQRERNLIAAFNRDNQRYFTPTLEQLKSQSLTEFSAPELLGQIEMILDALKGATYYSILAPLSLALRQAILKVSPEELDNSQTPEVASVSSLKALAHDARKLLPRQGLNIERGASLFAHLAEIPDGENILQRFGQWLNRYGYLSEVATDIAVPRWQENPQPMRELFSQFFLEDDGTTPTTPQNLLSHPSWKTKSLQERLNLKAQVTEIYSQLLAHLRWRFLAIEKIWLAAEILSQPGDIFFLEFAEIRAVISETDPQLREKMPQLIESRKSQWQQNQKLAQIPFVIYGNPPNSELLASSSITPKQQLRGIGASAGQAEGRVKILTNFQNLTDINQETILVVPYTDSGWSPVLARAGGLIAEVGGRLSHGAIIAREYGIPAVMDVHNATHLLRDGQRVRIDGAMGIVEIV